MNLDDREEREALAGEYVLGLLAQDDQVAFERELARDVELARSVADWQDRLLQVAPMPEPVAPAPHLWARIERDLPGAAPRSAGKASPRSARPGLWNSLRFWRFVGLTSTAVAAVALSTLLRFASQPEVFAPDYVAVLQQPGDKHPGWLVEVQAGKTMRLTPLARAAVGPRQAVELWTKPEGAAGPVSLGLVATDRRTVIPASRLPGLGPSQFFAVSLEPERGSPTGSPTGPVLAAGESVRL